MMRQLGFGEKWISLIMIFVTTVTYSVLINGQFGEQFQPTRGSRQGDLSLLTYS